jgi:hypothetical protein
MSNHDDNLPIIPLDGGWVGFRAFRYDPAHRGACLASLANVYWWKQGPLQADGVPTFQNGHGFYAFITLPKAIEHFGSVDEFIFCLTEHWGTRVQFTDTIRTEFAEIAAIIEPMRPTKKASFPREALRRDYPDVPIVHQNDIPRIVAEKGMAYVEYRIPAPPTQWIDKEGKLGWFHEGIAPDGWEELPPAATYPDEMHPADQRLRKAYFQDLTGSRYVFWESPAQELLHDFSLVLRMFPERMSIHLDPAQPERI